MNLRKIRTNKTADSMMEYVLILGIASAALIGMNIYIKRGVQGRLKEMADRLISDQHVAVIYGTTSLTDTVSTGNTDSDGSLGGSSSINFSEDKNITASSSVEDRISPYVPPFIPSDRGYRPPLMRPSD